MNLDGCLIMQIDDLTCPILKGLKQEGSTGPRVVQTRFTRGDM